jgi:hypothetical protein
VWIRYWLAAFLKNQTRYKHEYDSRDCI